jgi:hypothetical protein
MAATEVLSENGLISYNGNGFTTLDGLVITTINRTDIMPDHKGYMSLFGVVEDTLHNPSQTYTAEAAPRGMQNRNEAGVPVSGEDLFTPKKGFTTQEIALAYSVTKKFTEWAKKAKSIDNNNGEIQSEMLKVSNFARRLAASYDIRIAEEIVKMFTKGWSGGTLTPKGKNLFDTHTYGVAGTPTAGTFTNYTNGTLTFTSSAADILAGTTRLQALINQIKQARDENGKLVKQYDPYTLVVSRLRYQFWKQVLNDNSNFSGQGTNANQLNQFNFKGNLVKLEECALLGDPDYSGTAIGTTDMIFLLNKGGLTATEAFKLFRVYPLTIESWENKQTKVITIDGVGDIGVDHYAAELYVAGSTCA